MGLIYKNVRLTGSRGEREVKALFDSGSSRCFVSRDVAQAVGDVSPDAIHAAIWIEGHALQWVFYVVDDLTEPVIVGADFLQIWKIKLDLEHERLILDPSALEIKLI